MSYHRFKSCLSLFRRPAYLLMLAVLPGCSLKLPEINIWKDESQKLSPRVVKLGQPVPRGGGRYKVGAPYKIKGRRYEPREVEHYNRTGIASWYGKMFHGRLTANGEVYDMEALTAAHPTLPIPSYARVTNLKNGRSLIVRVNDRGPYAHNRIIDLSWAVASLLQMRRAGTAPVRVEYLGRAPLNGNENYERRYLARQPWAGPRIAFARSPARAMGHHLAMNAGHGSHVARGRKSAKTEHIATKTDVTASSPGAKISSLSLKPRQETAQLQRGSHHASLRPGMPVKRTRPDRASTPDRLPAPAKSPAIGGLVSAAPTLRSFKTYFVDAGHFRQKPVAEELAKILGEIAPARVERLAHNGIPVHRVRLGPFTRSDAAKAAARRIRQAGLRDAHIRETDG